MGWNANIKTNAFARKGNAGGAKEFRPRPNDHLVTVESIDPAKRAITGTNHMGAKAVYKIDAQTYARCQQRASSFTGGAKFMGHSIDEKMAAAIPVGQRIVLERARWVAKDKDGVATYEATRVINATAQSPEKLFTGLFSASKYDGRIASVQSWRAQAVSVANKEELKAFLDKAVEVKAQFDAGVKLPMPGLQMRAMRPTADGWVCFDSTHPYDYIPAQKDASGATVQQFSPMTKEKIQEIFMGYRQYLDQSFPNFREQGCVVDVMFFTSFKASNMSGSMALGSEFSSLSKLVSRESIISSDGDSYTGRNIAARGILELTEDKVTVKGRDVKIEARDLAQKLHVNSYQGDVREMVLAFDGKKVVLDESIRPVQTLPEPVEAPVAAIEDVSQEIPAQQAVSEPDPWALDDDNDLFGES